MDYLAAMNMNLGYALAVEKLAKIEVPPRATVLRVLVAELNRIVSHLVFIGTYGLDLGAFTPFLYCFRERELMLNLLEALCGARMTYSYVQVGGVTDDLPEGWVAKLREFLDYFEPRIAEYNTLLTDNHIFIKRTARVGVLAPDLAIAYGVTGPVLRGSGVARDLRKDEPYCNYEQYAFDVCIGTGGPGVVGDCWNRYFVRVQEMTESVKIVRQALDRLPEGEIRTKLPRVLKLPEGEVYLETEAPRGQMGFLVVGAGGPIPHRVKARSSCFCNLSVIDEICHDVMLADVPAILGSIDVVMGEVDR
jgi:NADH-quinone oxidoreductase subunit D